jgi:tetratricopeptide (TPR) repeat protein
MALYAKGILLESSTQGDANTNRQAACEAFRQAVVLDPDNRRPLEALVSALKDDKRFAEALEALEPFLARHPEEIELRFEAARLAEASERLDDAAHHCAVLFALKPDHRELGHALIRLYFLADRVPEALDAMREIHTRFNDTKSASLPLQWAIHFTQEGSQTADRALACLDLALPMRTNAAERAAILTLTAENRLLLGETNMAETIFLDAYHLNPAVNTAVMRLGALWSTRPDATNQLAHLIRTTPDAYVERLILTATHQALGQFNIAADVLSDTYAWRMRQGYFPSENVYLWHAALLETTQRIQAAERVLRDAIAAYPHSPELKNFLAYLWAEAGTHLDEADRLVTDALRQRPENAAYLDTKGWILYKLGRHYEALQWLLKAAELDKEEPVILDHVGDALKSIGRDSEAILFWSRSHHFDPRPEVEKKLRAHNAFPLGRGSPQPNHVEK